MHFCVQLTLACALCPSGPGLHRHYSYSQSLCHSPTQVKMSENYYASDSVHMHHIDLTCSELRDRAFE